MDKKDSMREIYLKCLYEAHKELVATRYVINETCNNNQTVPDDYSKLLNDELNRVIEIYEYYKNKVFGL